MSLRLNIHATALVAGRHGVLITGASGAGKSTLALSLIDHVLAHGQFARLVGDDGVDIAPSGGRLVAHTAANIGGLVEVHGLGPVAAPFMPACLVDLVVRLQDDAPRYQEPGQIELAGVQIPLLQAPQRHVLASIQAIKARLSLNFL